MRFNTTINNVKATEWGLNIQQSYLFAWFYELPSWATSVIIDGENYYFASKNKAVEELPLLTDKQDTMYRYYKQLENFDLITIKKIDSRDFVKLTEKAKSWNYKENIENCKSEYSEKNPTQLGKKSKNNSEKNPTYNIYNNNNNTNFQKENFATTIVDYPNIEFEPVKTTIELKNDYRNPLSSHAPIIDLQTFLIQYKNETLWVDTIIQKHKLKPEYLEIALKEYSQSAILNAKDKMQTLSQWKNHASNWINYMVKKKNN